MSDSLSAGISADAATLSLANAQLESLRVAARWYRREMADILLPLVEGQEIATDMKRLVGAAQLQRDDIAAIRDEIAQLEVRVKQLQTFLEGLANAADRLNSTLDKARQAWPKVVALANGRNGVHK